MAENLNYLSDDEESEWLANIDPSLFDKLSEAKQLEDSEIKTATQHKRRKLTLMFGRAGATP